MAIPEFTSSGDLPPGLHSASLVEVVHRFGSDSERRKLLGLRLDRIYKIALQTGHLARFVVFGSFVTAKSDPNDVDVFLIMNDNFNFGSLSGEARLLFHHSSAQDHFGCSLFWLRRLAIIGNEQTAIEDWQTKRDGTLRGIIEINEV